MGWVGMGHGGCIINLIRIIKGGCRMTFVYDSVARIVSYGHAWLEE